MEIKNPHAVKIIETDFYGGREMTGNKDSSLFSQLKELVDSHDTVSFDIFDTLLLRNINKPTDIFKILESEIGKVREARGLAKERIRAEAKAREVAEGGECTIEQIYKQMPKYRVSAQKIMERELSLEREFLTKNPFMKRVYDYACKKKKKIFLISDMYLPRAFIEEILKREGYSGDYTPFISAECGAGKGSGELFRLVKKRSGFLGKWVHIGDNFESDYRVPRSLSIDAFWYRGVSHYDKEDKPKTIAESIISGMKNNALNSGEELEYWERFGIRYASPIYLGFTHWLYSLTRDADNLYFIARDGYAIEKLYEKIASLHNKNIKTAYVYLSRRSLQMPVMTLDSKMDEAVRLICARHPVENGAQRLVDLFLKAQILPADVDMSVALAFGFSDLEEKITEENSHRAEKLIAYYSEKIRTSLAKNYAIAREYLCESGLDEYNTVNVMDIGWAGSIQNSIEKALKKRVRGYYFGTGAKDGRENFCDMYGYAFDFGKPEGVRDRIMKNVMMYELVFSAPHGSCLGYIKRDKVYPVLNKSLPYSKKIEEFQNAALSFSESTLRYYKYFDSISGEYAISAYDRFVSAPDKEDLLRFSELENDISIGSNKPYAYVARLCGRDMDGARRTEERLSSAIWRAGFVYDETVSDSEREIFEYNIRKDLSEKYLDFDLSVFKVYFDLGDGFSERNSVLLGSERRGQKYSARLSIPIKARSFRIDVIEGKMVRMSDIKIKVNGKDIKVYTTNADDGASPIKIFSTIDPQIFVKPKEDVYIIEFSANINIIE